MKKVSIITVCLNSEKTIEQTIQSVIKQSYGIKNIEYIVVDGKSTDGTINIISKYKNEISYFISESDKGIYDAMNKGISIATGDIIGILNSDDWYDLKTIENIVNCFENNDADIVYGEVWRVEKDETISQVKKTDSLNNTWHIMPIWHPATFVRKEVYRKLGCFSQKYEIAADYEFILRCYSNNIKFTYLDKKLTYFRSNGVSCTKHIKCAEETNEITLKYIDKAPNKEKVLEENEYRKKSAIFKEKYDTNQKDLIEKIPQIKNERIAVWGTGIWGRMIVLMLQNCGLKVDILVDSNQQRQGEYLLGIEIEDSDILREKDVFVIIAVRRIDENIKNKLCKLGIKREKYIFLEEWMRLIEII